MIVMKWIGIVLCILGLCVFGLGLSGATELVPAIVGASVLSLIGVVLAVVGHKIDSSFERDRSRVQELATRGVRRQGRVRDVVPYGSPHGGAVLQPGGALMVLQIELSGARNVTCLLVENSEQARARIGTEVTVLEHPDDPALRALQGYLPNGQRDRGL